jgi:hypothetical protein
LYSLRSELSGFKDFLQGQTDLFLSCRGKKEDFWSPFEDPLGPVVDAR